MFIAFYKSKSHGPLENINDDYIYEISDKILEKRLKVMKAKVRKIVEDPDDEPDEMTKNFSTAEKVYMAEVLKQIISNGTTDEATCKSRGPFSIVPEAEIQDAVDSVFELSGVFYAVRNTFCLSYNHTKTQ